MSEAPPTPPEPAPTPKADTLPELVPVRDAAELVGRSLSTVRSWVRSGRLEGHREEEGNAKSRLLVHRAALLVVAAELDPKAGREPEPEAPSPAPKAAAPDPTDGAEVAALRAEVAGLREALHLASTRGDDLSAVLRRQDGQRSEALAEARRRAETAEAVSRDLRADLEAARAELVGVRAELDTLRARAGLSWWRRLIGPPSALPGPTPEG